MTPIFFWTRCALSGFLRAAGRVFWGLPKVPRKPPPGGLRVSVMTWKPLFYWPTWRHAGVSGREGNLYVTQAEGRAGRCDPAHTRPCAIQGPRAILCVSARLGALKGPGPAPSFAILHHGKGWASGRPERDLRRWRMPWGLGGPAAPGPAGGDAHVYPVYRPALCLSGGPCDGITMDKVSTEDRMFTLVNTKSSPCLPNHGLHYRARRAG